MVIRNENRDSVTWALGGAGRSGMFSRVESAVTPVTDAIGTPPPCGDNQRHSRLITMTTTWRYKWGSPVRLRLLSLKREAW